MNKNEFSYKFIIKEFFLHILSTWVYTILIFFILYPPGFIPYLVKNREILKKTD